MTLQKNTIEEIQKRIGHLEHEQILIWRKMSGARRLDLAFQAYQFAIDAVRVTEKRRHPALSENDLTWRIVRRLQGNQQLGTSQWNPSATTN